VEEAAAIGQAFMVIPYALLALVQADMLLQVEAQSSLWLLEHLL
jgi:hypothetical protein